VTEAPTFNVFWYIFKQRFLSIVFNVFYAKSQRFNSCAIDPKANVLRTTPQVHSV